MKLACAGLHFNASRHLKGLCRQVTSTPITMMMPPTQRHMEVSLNYCSQNGGNVHRAPYYNRNPNIGPRIDSNLGQSPHPIHSMRAKSRSPTVPSPCELESKLLKGGI